MATAQIQYTVTFPVIDFSKFQQIAARNQWDIAPVKEKKKEQKLTAEQLSIIEMAKKADIKRNKKAPKVSMSEIIKEVRDYRDGK